MADWLRLAELLTERAPELLDGLGFPERYSDILRAFADSTPPDEPPLERALRIESLERLADLDPELSEQALGPVDHARLRDDDAGAAERGERLGLPGRPRAQRPLASSFMRWISID